MQNQNPRRLGTIFQLITHRHAAMYTHCRKILRHNKHIIPELVCCWGFVDALHRISVSGPVTRIDRPLAANRKRLDGSLRAHHGGLYRSGGEFESYGMKTLFNVVADAETEVWVEDFWLSRSRVIEKYRGKCRR